MKSYPRRKIPAGIIFSDLDGTLLDHHTYDFDPARHALELLESHGIDLVLCSSKTRAELLVWQRRLSIAGPFVSENGGGVFLTGGGPLAACFPELQGSLSVRSFGTPCAVLRTHLREVAARLGLAVRGFGDMTLEEIVSLTGLPSWEAELAHQRDYDEPLLFEEGTSEEQKIALRDGLAEISFNLVEGGRFWHLTGGNDKGLAVRWLLDAYGRCYGAVPPSLALGDSDNDFPMLLSAGNGVLVEKPGGGHARGAPPGVTKVKGAGPLGWAKAVTDWIEKGLSSPK